MRLRVIVSPTLTLTKEEKVFNFGDEFEVDEARGIEILKSFFNGKPVVEFVSSNGENSNDESLIKEKEALEARIKELEETNNSLLTEKEALEARIKELEEKNENKKEKGDVK